MNHFRALSGTINPESVFGISSLIASIIGLLVALGFVLAENIVFCVPVSMIVALGVYALSSKLLSAAEEKKFDKWLEHNPELNEMIVPETAPLFCPSCGSPMRVAGEWIPKVHDQKSGQPIWWVREVTCPAVGLYHHRSYLGSENPQDPFATVYGDCEPRQAVTPAAYQRYLSHMEAKGKLDKAYKLPFGGPSLPNEADEAEADPVSLHQLVQRASGQQGGSH